MGEWHDEYRVEYVRRELLAHGFATDRCKLLERLSSEVAYALFAPLHERSQPTYGAIITNHWQQHCSQIPEFMSNSSIPCSRLDRTLADGASSFAVFDQQSDSNTLWISHAALIGEAALVSLRDEILFKSTGRSPHDPPADADLILIQRLADGSITVLHWDGVTTFRNGHWAHKHYQYKYRVEETLEHRLLHLPLQEHTKQTVRHLLRLCLHVLSPAGCGATILVALDDESSLRSCLIDKKERLAPARLTVSDRVCHRTLLHLLGQVDGATILSSDGTLRSVGAMLKPKLEHTSPSLGGARQLTARDTSMSLDSPILTVSADGPVYVYHQGTVIADFSKAPPQS